MNTLSNILNVTSMIRESFLIHESLLNKKLWIFDSRINLELNHFKKRFESTFSLCFSKKIAMRFEWRIIDSDSQQALIVRGKKLDTLTDYWAFNSIVHDAVRHLCSCSNFSKILHQTSRLLTTTARARWQYFPKRNEHWINDFRAVKLEDSIRALKCES